MVICSFKKTKLRILLNIKWLYGQDISVACQSQPTNMAAEGCDSLLPPTLPQSQSPVYWFVTPVLSLVCHCSPYLSSPVSLVCCELLCVSQCCQAAGPFLDLSGYWLILFLWLWFCYGLWYICLPSILTSATFTSSFGSCFWTLSTFYIPCQSACLRVNFLQWNWNEFFLIINYYNQMASLVIRIWPI